MVVRPILYLSREGCMGKIYIPMHMSVRVIDTDMCNAWLWKYISCGCAQDHSFSHVSRVVGVHVAVVGTSHTYEHNC
jgi:hypothetical protein